MPYFAYILRSEKTGRYYVGSCGDMDTRIAQHNAGRNKSTGSGAPWHLMYLEPFATRSEAVRRKNEIKAKKSRKYIEWLISSAG